MSDLWYWDRGRIISLAIACGYIILAFFTGGAYDWLQVLGFTIFALACIWFGDELGGYSGSAQFIPLRQTPGSFIRLAGWVLLLLPIIIAIVAAFNK